MNQKRCYECKIRVHITEDEFEEDCLGIDEMIRCTVCQKEEVAVLTRAGLADCVLHTKGFRRF